VRIRQYLRVLASTTALCAGAGACSSPGSSSANGLALPHFNDITTASPKIQTAARAVVRVRTAGQVATAFFISPSGLLLTNNHVLGISVCPVQGCYVTLTQMHERGQTRQQSSIVFAIPTAIDVGLDVAVVQLYDQPNGNQFGSPDYLSLQAQDAASLLNQHVTIVGHPEGFLKKWTDGEVADADGDWITSTAYTLPGDSGSPILNDDGQVVGLLHRGPTSEDLFTKTGVDMYSVGTASAPIVAAMNAALPATLVSVTAATTTEQFLAYDYVYLNARTATITVDGASAGALALLGEACDTALARTDFTSPDDLNNALIPCYHAESWTDCRTDASAVSYGVVCPTSMDATAWNSRYQKANSLWLGMNGQPDYTAVSFAIAHLQSSQSTGVIAGAESLQQVLATASPVLDFRLAYYLAAFSISSYEGTLISSYVLNYKQVPNYDLQAFYVAYAATWLNGDGALTKSELQTFSQQLLADPNINVNTRLAIEDYLYQMDAL
jgi:hypothetical protein